MESDETLPVLGCRNAGLSRLQVGETDTSRGVIRSMERGIRNSLLIILCCVFGIILMVFIAAHRIDHYASDRSVEQVQTLVKIELEQLANLALEYAWWNEAVEMVVYQRDTAWAQENVSGYLEERYGLTWALSLDRHGTLVDGRHDEQALTTLPGDVMSPALEALIEQAVDTDFSVPRPASALLPIQGRPALVSVASFTVYAPSEREVSRSHGALVLIKEIGAPLLSRWSRDFQIAGLALATDRQAEEPLAGADESLPLKAASGQVIGALHWAPEKAGQAFLGIMLPWAVAGAAMALLCSLVLYCRLRAYGRVAFRHLAELAASRKTLVHQANFDHLTGLANRALFKEQVAQEMASCLRHGRKAAVLYIDLDGFKAINDSLGHACGDELLCRVAERLTQVTRTEDSVARFGGDEFCLLLSGIAAERDVERTVDRLHALISPPVMLGDRAVQVGASVGIVIIPEQTDSLGDVFRYADLAMYQAKAKGANQHCFFSPALEEARQGRIRQAPSFGASLD